MSNSVEILRAICFDHDEMEKIQNHDFSELEIDFMILFKQIYEFGSPALSMFIDKLNSEGHKLSEYSILYYVDQLLNGCFGEQAKLLSDGKRYFCKLPDTMFTLANVTSSTANTSNIINTQLPLGTTVDIFNKTPEFVQKNLMNAVFKSEELFRSSVYSAIVVDNTLPLIDKNNESRFVDEPLGDLAKKSNANYLVKDCGSQNIIKALNSKIVENVKNYLEIYTESSGSGGSPPEFENFRVIKYKKEYSPFSTEKNTSTTNVNPIIKKYLLDNNKEVEVELDIMGEVLKTQEEISINEKKYNLRTNIGQLGL